MNPVEEITVLIEQASGGEVMLDESLVARAQRHFHHGEFSEQAPHDTRHDAGIWLVRPVESLFYPGKTVALIIVHDEARERGLCAQVRKEVEGTGTELWELTVPDFQGAKWFGPLEDLKPAE